MGLFMNAPRGGRDPVVDNALDAKQERIDTSSIDRVGSKIASWQRPSMSRFTLSFGLLLSLLAGALIASSTISLATEAFETAGNVRWIVFASRQDVDEAIGLARRFGSEFGPLIVMSSTNGWYAVVAGPLTVPDPAALKKKLTDLWWPPKDTFASKGQTFVEKVWEASKSPVLASASPEKGPHVASAVGVEVRVNANGVANVRSSGQDVASVRFDDQGPNNSTAAEIARLDRSSPVPQVVVTHFTGGAHCCTLMKVMTLVNGRWETVDVGKFDSDGPQVEDLNGDGAAELVGKDDSFDYAFASYAESYAPPKVLQLAGTRSWMRHTAPNSGSRSCKCCWPIRVSLPPTHGGTMGSLVAGSRTTRWSGTAPKHGARCSTSTIGIQIGTCRYARLLRMATTPALTTRSGVGISRPLCENFSPRMATASMVSSLLRSQPRAPVSTATRPGRQARSKSVGLRGSPSWTTSWPPDTHS